MAKKTILFIDSVCPAPYDSSTLYSRPQGGTESTVTRVADGLADTGLFHVAVEQHCRTESHESKTRYTPYGAIEEADHVVVLRDASKLKAARERFPKAKLSLWCHDLWSVATAKEVVPLVNDSVCKKIIGVSAFHKNNILECLRENRQKVQASLLVSYPPLDKSLEIYQGPYDKYQLAWFSSPHKGLARSLAIFNQLKREDSKFTFVVHNPGYFENYNQTIPEGVIIKPKGSYFDAIETVKNSLCVFYPNVEFPETFGLVYAEANQLGTPVLAHPFAAAPETLEHPAQHTDCTQVTEVIKKVLEWKDGRRPIVRGKAQFRLKHVVREWISHIFND
jgi:glycosyltransferase involved in cell wall biosynthesis